MKHSEPIIASSVAVLVVAALALVAPGPGVARADATGESPYSRDRRASYIARALDALRAMEHQGLDALERDLYLGGRKQCKADFGPPTASCLIALAGERCRQEPAARQTACRLVADVLITNQLGERELIDDQTRAQLMGRGTSFHQAMQDELLARYAELVARMALETGAPAEARTPGTGTPSTDLAGDIDDFCVDHARSHRMAWQRCVAAITWYITTETRSPTP